MTTEMVHQTQSSGMRAVDIKAQVNLIQEVMKGVMKSDVHYGIIPGCKKPTLYKPGAEKLAATFRLSIDPEIEDLSTHDEIRYRIKTRIRSMASGGDIGCGVGECSSNEEKYMWRKAVCEEEFEETPEDRRREKWASGRNGAYKIKQVRTSVADIANTILKMAKKRSFIDGILTCTAASDIFEQDLEDLPAEFRNASDPDEAPQSGKPDLQPPKPKAPTSNGNGMSFISENQGKRMIAIALNSGYSYADIDQYLANEYALNKRSEVTKDIYEDVVAHFEIAKA